MADIKRVSPAEAKRLVDEEGYVYVDVRSSREFASGHPEGSVNVPLLEHDDSGQMAQNPDFIRVMKASFAPDAKLLIGCQAGMRSLNEGWDAGDLLGAERLRRGGLIRTAPVADAWRALHRGNDSVATGLWAVLIGLGAMVISGISVCCSSAKSTRPGTPCKASSLCLPS